MALCLLTLQSVHKVSHMGPAVIAISGIGIRTQSEHNPPSNAAFHRDKKCTEMIETRRTDWPKTGSVSGALCPVRVFSAEAWLVISGILSLMLLEHTARLLCVSKGKCLPLGSC